MEGKTLNDRYRLDEVLGEGGMGVVYRAQDILLGRDVAVKLLSKQRLGTSGSVRLLNEARNVAQLDHPNIVSVFDAGEIEGSPYVVMQLIRGKILREHFPLGLDEILHVTRQICEALDHAHEHDLIHRDIKPENVMLTEDGTVKLMDFGIAHNDVARLTIEGEILGTIAYMAPEQVTGEKVSHQTDLYALGVMIYEMVTGELPFTAENPYEIITQHLHNTPVPPTELNPNIPAELEALILRMLSKDPANRSTSAREVGEVILKLASRDQVAVDETSRDPGRVVNGLAVRKPRLPQEKEVEKLVPTNLPVQVTPIIGREKELAIVDDLLENPDVRLVTIVGPGGMGKSRLGLAAADRQLKRKSKLSEHPFNDGVYFIQLAPVTSPDRIALAVAAELGLLFKGDSDPVEQILKFLENQRNLLVLDNFEHLIRGAELIAAILERAPGVSMLVTSRERLLISGEAVLWLGGLSFPDDSEVDLVDVNLEGDAGAVALFLYHTRLVRPYISFTLDDLAEIARICKLVQGMPLAIILATSWIEALSLVDLKDAIANSMDMLASEQRDLLPRQRSIRAIFEASWARLHPEDREVFPKLSVFRGGFTLKAAADIAGANIFVLRTLIAKSLIGPLSQNRYELHELLRQFAADKLGESKELDTVQNAHGQYYLETLKNLEADLKGRRQTGALAEIDADLNNFQQAWGWALAQNQYALVDKALEAITLYMVLYSRGNEAVALFLAAYKELDGGDGERLLGRLLTRHAWIKSVYGMETDTIDAALDKSWAIAEQQEDHREMAQVLLVRGWHLTWTHGDRKNGLVEFERAFKKFERLGDSFYMSLLLGRIGFCHELDPELLIDYTRQSLELALETGNDSQAVLALINLGIASMEMGASIPRSEEMFQQALEIQQRNPSPMRSFAYYFNKTILALAGFLRGDMDQITRYQPPQEHTILGKVNTTVIAAALATNALITAIKGDLDTAEQLANRSLNYQSNRHFVFPARWALMIVYVDRGNLTEASRQLSSVYLSQITMFSGVMTRSLPVAAMILAKSGQPERAAQIFSLAHNHPASQIGWLRNWPSGAVLRAELEQLLGAANFQKAWAIGRELNLAETIAELAEEFLV